MQIFAQPQVLLSKHKVPMQPTQLSIRFKKKAEQVEER